jgi:sec-independent protein translocase protein TatC
MSFTEHLGELRTRLIRVAVTLVVTFMAGWFMSNGIVNALRWPIDSGMEDHNARITASWPIGPEGNPIPPEEGGLRTYQWVTQSPQEGFVVQLRLAMYFALLISVPVILFQICAFVFPGLKPNERGFIMSLLGGSAVLAFFGTMTAYFGVLPLLMPYLLEYNPVGIAQNLQLGPTMSFILVLIAGFAIAFQFPMLVVAGVFLDLVKVSALTQYRRYAIVAIAIVAAVLTPPDPVSMTIMMIPLLVLYEVSIFFARIITWRRGRKVEPESTDITTV